MGMFDTPFKTEPYLTTVTIVVHWVTFDELDKMIESKGTVLGASHVGLREGDLVHMYLVKPKDFGGRETETAGHELWHALGATHE